MTPTDITFILLFSLPAYVAMMCGLYLARMAYLKENPFGRRPFVMTIVLYFVTTLMWFLQILYFVLPEVYVTLHTLFFLTCLLIYVFSYRFVFEITKANPSEKFSFFHFLTPLSGFIIMLVWSFLVPLDVQLSIVRSGGGAVDGYNLFSMFFNSGLPFMLFMNVIYSALGLRRIARYRKVVVNYSADEYRGALTWLYHYIFAMLAFFAGVGSFIIVSRIFPVSPWFLIIPSLIAVFKYVILLHNILLENFVIISTDSGDSTQLLYDERLMPDSNGLQLSIDEKSILAVKNLETYIQRKKPYLNPNFKITDMMRDLNTNRTSLSSLINRTYGVNFSRFINRYRLHELKEIQSLQANRKFSEEELVNRAGFSDYRGYLRVKFREEIYTNTYNNL